MTDCTAIVLHVPYLHYCVRVRVHVRSMKAPQNKNKTIIYCPSVRKDLKAAMEGSSFELTLSIKLYRLSQLIIHCSSKAFSNGKTESQQCWLSVSKAEKLVNEWRIMNQFLLDSSRLSFGHPDYWKPTHSTGELKQSGQSLHVEAGEKLRQTSFLIWFPKSPFQQWEKNGKSVTVFIV